VLAWSSAFLLPDYLLLLGDYFYLLVLVIPVGDTCLVVHVLPDSFGVVTLGTLNTHPDDDSGNKNCSFGYSSGTVC
jgi:hypothetical protein